MLTSHFRRLSRSLRSRKRLQPVRSAVRDAARNAVESLEQRVLFNVVSINDVTHAEGNSGTTSFVFTVTRTGNLNSSASVDFATVPGTASGAAGDYTAQSGTINFAANQSTATITILVNGDTTVEADETFGVYLFNANHVDISDGFGLGTITNDDVVPPTLAINDVTLAEGNSGTTNFVFTVTRSGSLAAASSVNFATADGTATVAGNDYVTKSGTLTFAANQATATITVVVNGDTAVEGNETFTVNLSGATGATISDGTGVGTITNDDASLSINDVTLAEGNAGTTNFVFTVTRTGSLAAASSVNFATADGTATVAGNDYVAKSGTLNFAANQATATITVAVNGDTAVEGNETFNVNLSSATGATISDGTGVGTITNDDVAPPTLAINDVTLAEGNAGTTNFVFTVTRTGSLAAASSVNFATGDGTATVAGNDYVANSGTLNFAANQATATITVAVKGDTTVEANETFNVNLSGATGATISDGTGVGTINNDDVVPPTLAINDVALAEGNSGTTNFVFTVTRTGSLAGASSVNFATADGTATAAGGDYTANSGTLNFAANQATATITVAVNGDSAVEANETFNVNLSGATGATISDATGLGTINNDDVAPPTLAINDVTLAEGNAGTTNFVFTVTRTGSLAGGSSVNFATADGTATVAGGDYTANSGMLSFAVNQATATITVAVNGDTTIEGNETFNVNLSGAIGAAITDGTGVGTITNDDVVPPTLAINDVTLAEGNSGTTSFVFTVTRTGNLGGTSSVNFATADGTATVAGNDYVANSGTLNFAANQATATITVLVNGGTTPENNETFTVNLSGATGATISDGSGVGTILNDDHTPVGNNDTFALSEHATIFGNVLANDTDADPGTTLRVISVTVGAVTTPVPAAGTVTFNALHGPVTIGSDGSFSYANDGTDATTDGFTYVVSDDGTAGAGHTASATVSLTVSNVVPTVTTAGSGTSGFVGGPITGRTYTFADPGVEGTWNVSFNFGDGTPVITETRNAPGTFPVPAHTYTTAGTKTVMVTVGDGESVGTTTYSVNVTALDRFQVTAFAPTPSGFNVTFNRPFDPASLNLYGASPDVVVIGPDNLPVRGSLVWDAGSATLSFVASGAYEVVPAKAGILAPGTYSVTLRGGASALNDGFGNNLDGSTVPLLDSTPGGDVTTTFTVAAPPAGARTVSLDDFARGPGQIVNVPNTGSGIPINVSDRSGVASFALTLSYDASLLDVSGIIPPAGWTVTPSQPLNTLPTTGRVTLTLTGSGPAAAAGSGFGPLVSLQASVRPGASYGDSELLDLEVQSLRDTAGALIPSVADDAVHSVNYVGDTNGNQLYSSTDAVLILVQSAANNANPASYPNFAAYPNTDATVVADTNTNSLLTSGDATQVLAEVSGIQNNNPGSPLIPGIPPLPPISVGKTASSAVASESSVISTVLGDDSDGSRHHGLFSETSIQPSVVSAKRG